MLGKILRRIPLNKNIRNSIGVKLNFGLQIVTQQFPKLFAIGVYVFITLFHPSVVIVIMSYARTYRQFLAYKNPYATPLTYRKPLEGLKKLNWSNQLRNIYMPPQKLSNCFRKIVLPRTLCFVFV